MNIYNNLPDDLQFLIVNKIIYKQNSNLLKDIVNYKKTKDIIFNKYSNIGFEFSENYSNDFNAYASIENDLFSYFNDNMSTELGISNNNKIKMEKILAYKIIKNIKGEYNAINNFHFNPNIYIISRINRYIATLTPKERNQFINEINNMYKIK